jgi:hypothetical protein
VAADRGLDAGLFCPPLDQMIGIHPGQRTGGKSALLPLKSASGPRCTVGAGPFRSTTKTRRHKTEVDVYLVFMSCGDSCPFLSKVLRLLLARDETERGDARDEEVAAAAQRREARQIGDPLRQAGPLRDAEARALARLAKRGGKQAKPVRVGGLRTADRSAGTVAGRVEIVS